MTTPSDAIGILYEAMPLGLTAKGQLTHRLLQLWMIEQWFDANVTLMRNAIIASVNSIPELDERPPINVSYPFAAYLFDCALITTTPDGRSLFHGSELTGVDDAAFVWEIA